ncbi:MAG: FixH family protein [Candidatus Korobacteraceae bacterium]|jgi:hypothetical protein
MRLRILAIAAVAVLTYFVMEHKLGLPAPPAPAALIMSLRNQLSPFRFTLATDPEPPECDGPTILKIHAIDAAGKPASGLIIEADVYMSNIDHPAQHVTLRANGAGNYEGRVELEVAGSWNVDLTARKDGKMDRQRLSIEVTGARGSPQPRNPNEDAPES